jgi:O-antigen/teichoic acid export membrane protein
MLKSAYSRLHELFHRFFQSEIIRRVIKNSGYLFTSSVFSSGISMLVSILSARLLGVSAFGVLGVITMFTTVLNKLVSFRMGELVVKYVGQYIETGDQPRAAATFKGAAIAESIASVIAFGLVLLVAPLGARYFAKDPNTSSMFVIYGGVVLANLIAESSGGLLQIFDRFRRIGMLSVISSAVTFSIVLYVYITKGSFLGVLLAYLIGKSVLAIGMTISALIEASHHWGKQWWRISLAPLRPQVRELASFAINTNISASLSLITKDSELLWVALLRNPLETGYYKVALSMANIVQLPINPLPAATYPELSREVARKNFFNVRYVLRQGSILAGSYTLAVTLGLFLIGRPLLGFMYTPAFLPAYPALLIILIGYLVANTFYWNRVALLAIGLPEVPTKVNLVLALFKVSAIVLLVPTYGYLACAALLSASYILGVSWSVIKFRSEVARQERLYALTLARLEPDQK